MAEDYKKGRKLGANVSDEFIYKELIGILGSKDFYSMDSIDSKGSVFLFEKLNDKVDYAISFTKLLITPVVGVSLKKGERCTIGSVEFLHPEDFLCDYTELISILRTNEESRSWEALKEMCGNSHVIAQIKIKNRTDDLAKNSAGEAMKRVYTLIRLTLPILGSKYSFINTLGEEYLERRYSMIFYLSPERESNVFHIRGGQTRNFFTSEEINLAELVATYQSTLTLNDNFKWFSRYEEIISKFITNEEMSDFENRVWTALYWFGEAMSEIELSSLIVKYATCLEALFNSREGGISEQIAEFAAFTVGSSKEVRISVYEDIKALYNLRSDAVHGRTITNNIDERFLSRINRICQHSVIQMVYYSGEPQWQNSKGYQDFVKFILKEYRFSVGLS